MEKTCKEILKSWLYREVIFTDFRGMLGTERVHVNFYEPLTSEETESFSEELLKKGLLIDETYENTVVVREWG